jgi:mono/diheme cytochrome c family protein
MIRQMLCRRPNNNQGSGPLKVAPTSCVARPAVFVCAVTVEIFLLSTPAAHAADTDLIRRGEYVATAGDCVACHTAPGGKAFAGGLAIQTPLGEIYASNITPSKQYGIGNYTLAQFTDALRKGIRADGARLYPAMPYTSYALTSDEDIGAMYAYFMKAVTPVEEPSPPTSLPFPFDIRLMMAGWNLLFLDSSRFSPDPAKSADWNRGACQRTRALRGLSYATEFHDGGTFLARFGRCTAWSLVRAQHHVGSEQRHRRLGRA